MAQPRPVHKPIAGFACLPPGLLTKETFELDLALFDEYV